MDGSNWIRMTCGKSSSELRGCLRTSIPRSWMTRDSVCQDERAGVFRHDQSDLLCHVVDETRINLNGVFLKTEREGNKIDLNMVATDGHRLAMVSIQPGIESSPEMEQGIIIPRKGINEIRKLVDDGEEEIEFGAKKGVCVLKKSNVVLKVSLIDAEYPDYKRVIPKDKG